MSKRIISLLTVAMLLIIFGVACSDKEEQDTLPELPPVEALLMDFSDFDDNPTEQEALNSLVEYTNFLYSYGTVSIWNILVTAPMILPVATYLESFNHTPVYLGDNTWQWSYSKTIGMNSYSARLVTQRISNDDFKVEMFVTQQEAFEDFKWFEGTVKYNRTHAEWTMYESPQNNVEWLDIEWNKDWEEEVSDITYTIVKSGHAEEGSYITFGIVDDVDYDAYYTISHSQKDTYIKWNTTSKTGRVKGEVNFGDANWHCWNELFQDVDCN